MSFAHPTYLWLLLLLPLFAGLFLWRARSRMRASARFGQIRHVSRLTRGERTLGLRTTRATLVTLAFGFFIVALAGPRYGGTTRVLKQRGVDVVIALDFSKSMLARDVRPNRIERAKAEILEFVKDLGGDRVGLVAFAGDTMAFPMTTDYAALALFFRDLQPADMPVGGTAIGRALIAAQRLMERSTPDGLDESGRPDRVVILMTDGEDHEGDPVAAAETLKAAGIRVFTVGIGSASGEPIPTYAPDGTWTGYIKDEQGQVVTTALTSENEAVLSQVAETTAGQYFRAERGGVGMGQIRSAMKRMKQSERDARKVTVHEPRYVLALLPALLLLLLEALLPESLIRRRKRNEAQAAPPSDSVRHLGKAAALLLCAGLSLVGATARAWDPFVHENPDVREGNQALLEGDAEGALKAYTEAAKTLPDRPGVQMNRGLAQLATNDLDAAATTLEQATRPPDSERSALSRDVRAEAYYNLGVAQYRRADLAAKSAESQAAGTGPMLGGPGQAPPSAQPQVLPPTGASPGERVEVHKAAQAAFREAAEAFKASLRLHPGNRDAAHNLEVTLQRIREEEEKQKQAEQEQKAQQEQDQENQGEGEKQPDGGEPTDPQDPNDPSSEQSGEQDTPPEDPSEEQSKGGDEQPDEAQQGQDEQDQAEPKPPEPQDEPQAPEQATPPGQLPQEVEQALDALQDNEQNLERQRARQRARSRRQPTKDW